MKLKDRVAIITGSGRGIGRAIAERFAREGAAILLNSRTEKELQQTADAIQQAGAVMVDHLTDRGDQGVCSVLVAPGT